VIVSTDDPEIAEVAKSFGAEIPFLRPAEIADDISPVAVVVEHAITELEKDGSKVDAACLIYATAPFVQPEFLREALQTLEGATSSTVLSVTDFPFPIFRGLKMNEREELELFWPEHEYTRSQDLPEAYHDAGQFCWVKRDAFMERKALYASDMRPYLIPRYLVQDIDTEADWETAEVLFESFQKRKDALS